MFTDSTICPGEVGFRRCSNALKSKCFPAPGAAVPRSIHVTRETMPLVATGQQTDLMDWLG